tara:strand:+ start:11781 stop:12050 length:270 start_codon:yes stop_codon:yes gene_type:complete
LKKIKKTFTTEEKKGMRKFSYVLVLLKMTTGMLFLILLLILGVRFEVISLIQALIITLGTLVIIYFILPLMATKVFDSIAIIPTKEVTK